jgi:hypothetical protein
MSDYSNLDFEQFYDKIISSNMELKRLNDALKEAQENLASPALLYVSNTNEKLRTQRKKLWRLKKKFKDWKMKLKLKIQRSFRKHIEIDGANVIEVENFDDRKLPNHQVSHVDLKLKQKHKVSNLFAKELAV